jgi:putative membrane protein
VARALSVILAKSHPALSESKDNRQNNSTPLALCAAVVAVLVWSLVGCHDLLTWFLEVLPVLIGVPLLIHLYPRYRFTNLVYSLIAVHTTILMIGGHYTYALMPVFQWIKDYFGLDRNYYDRLGHFTQGFVPAFIAREVLLRWSGLARGKMLTYLVFSCCMAISALYELFEFAAAKATGTAADAFLGTQGDVWDTQWDMTFCLIGATCMLLFFTRIHDRALSKLKS